MAKRRRWRKRAGHGKSEEREAYAAVQQRLVDDFGGLLMPFLAEDDDAFEAAAFALLDELSRQSTGEPGERD